MLETQTLYVKGALVSGQQYGRHSDVYKDSKSGGILGQRAIMTGVVTAGRILTASPKSADEKCERCAAGRSGLAAAGAGKSGCLFYPAAGRLAGDTG